MNSQETDRQDFIIYSVLSDSLVIVVKSVSRSSSSGADFGGSAVVI